MNERLLSDEETKSIYKKIDELGLKPYDIDTDRKSSELYYELDGKKYRLVYTPDLDWFCDIAYEGDY
jgi:hypothetical protein